MVAIVLVALCNALANNAHGRNQRYQVKQRSREHSQCDIQHLHA